MLPRPVPERGAVGITGIHRADSQRPGRARSMRESGGEQRRRPPRWRRRLRRGAELGWDWLRSRRTARGLERSLEEIECFCLFVGYPRSGHSLLGSLLDAHPEAVIAHELDVLRYVDAPFRREQLTALLLENSRRIAEAGRMQTGYRYDVPGQWQGRASPLRVLGDKRGGGATRRLQARPGRLEALRRLLGVPLRFVHVVRNPFDNISAICRLGRRRDLDRSIQRYLSLLGENDRLRAGLSDREWIDVRHEELIESPRMELERVCAFLGLEAGKGYLHDCGGVVWTSAHRARHEIEWTKAALGRVQDGIDRSPVLRGYSFDD